MGNVSFLILGSRVPSAYLAMCEIQREAKKEKIIIFIYLYYNNLLVYVLVILYCRYEYIKDFILHSLPLQPGVSTAAVTPHPNINPRGFVQN